MTRPQTNEPLYNACGGFLLPCCGHEDLDHWITETEQGCNKCGCQDRGPESVEPTRSGVEQLAGILAAAGTMRFDPTHTESVIEGRLARHGIDYEYFAEWLRARGVGTGIDVDRLREAIDKISDGGNFPLAGDSADDLATEYARLSEEGS